MMDNKEVIDRLQEYLSKQDPAVVTRMCANLMLDMHRHHNIMYLDRKVRACLRERTRLNSKELERFIEKGPREDFKLIDMPSDESE